VKLAIPGGDGPLVHYLRSLADSRSVIAAAEGAARAVVVGASFIGLEAAAGWDRLEVVGSIAQKSCLVAYRVADRISAAASIYRDRESLQVEAMLERGDQAGREALLASVRA